ncbi:hypothetical protein ACRCUN_06105 [Mycobacterium sp. LTG2003]
MDIYIVLDGQRVVGASTRLQGAEVIRARAARQKALDLVPEHAPTPERLQAYNRTERHAYDRMTIANTELEDDDD